MPNFSRFNTEGSRKYGSLGLGALGTSVGLWWLSNRGLGIDAGDLKGWDIGMGLGIASLGAGATKYYWNKYAVDQFDTGAETRQSTKVGTRVLMGVGLGAMVISGAGMAQGDGGAEGTTSPSITTEVTIPSAVVSEITTTVPAQIPETTVVDMGGQCAIVAPIPAGDNSETVIENVKALQSWMQSHNSAQDGAPYYQAEIDGDAGPVLGAAVDKFQIDNGLDPAQPWNQETCRATGDLWQPN